MSEPTPRQWYLLHTRTEQLSSDDEVIEKGVAVFEHLVIGELRRAVNAEIGIAAMLLACCAVDFLTTLHAGDDSKAHLFYEFVGCYLKRYDKRRLWETRNAIAHSYALPQPNSGYAFSLGRTRAREHLQGGRIVVDCFADDIEAAGRALLGEAAAGADTAIRANVVKRLKTPGVILMEERDTGG